MHTAESDSFLNTIFLHCLNSPLRLLCSGVPKPAGGQAALALNNALAAGSKVAGAVRQIEDSWVVKKLSEYSQSGGEDALIRDVSALGNKAMDMVFRGADKFLHGLLNG